MSMRAVAMIGAVLNIAVAAAFEAAWVDQLSYGDRWAARTSLWTILLLVDNLCVLAWYANLTHRLAQTAERQLRFHVEEFRIAQKPIVFLNVRRGPAPDHAHYVVTNVGSGLAVNVYLIERPVRSIALGALPPGGELPILGNPEDPLRDHGGRMPSRLIVAEAMRSRTQQWIVTLNVLDRAGDVRHRLVEFDSPTPLSLQELLDRHGERFHNELDRFRQEIAEL